MPDPARAPRTPRTSRTSGAARPTRTARTIGTTRDSVLSPAAAASADGARPAYRTLEARPGEPQLPRAELLGQATEWADRGRLRSLLRFVHVTDYQLADPASPGRMDFVQRYAERPEWAGMIPAYRPQEFVSTHAFEATARTVAALAAELEQGPGAPVGFVLTTGDNTDSAQLNELRAFLALMDGGATVDPGFDGEPPAIPSRTVSGDYYNPDPASYDRYKRLYGFPDRPGLLEAATEPFAAEGFDGLPWLACFGNHDCLAQGRAAPTAAFQRLVTGDRRPVALPASAPDGLPAAVPDPEDPSGAYLADPTVLSTGPSITVRPRSDRRLVSRTEYIQAHLESPGAPRGHGFTDRNRSEGTAYYCYDAIPGVRLIVLDSTNPAGHVTGSLDRRQFAWLRERLAEVHSSHLDDAGRHVETGRPDRAVILASHHGLAMFDNTMTGAGAEVGAGAGAEAGSGAGAGAEEPRVLGPEVEALLHRFGNVVLWLAGHQHLNSAVPHAGPGGAAGAGFWQVVTSGLCEWPCQSRLLELLVTEDQEAGPVLVIRSTMLDHAGPPAPSAGLDLWDLASAHREICANEPTRVGGPLSAGTPLDRNVDLLVPIRLPLAAALRAR